VFNNSRAQRKGLLIATLAAALLTALVGYWLMHRLQTDSVQSIQQRIDTWRLSLTLGRWTVIALVAFGWNAGVECFAKTAKINSAQTNQLQRFRWRAVTWLVILELVLGQGIVVKFLGVTAGPIVR
jgi:predicted CDP-diglyceride synthetase/phosphatidate cytidylyltransferase